MLFWAALLLVWPLNAFGQAGVEQAELVIVVDSGDPADSQTRNLLLSGANLMITLMPEGTLGAVILAGDSPLVASELSRHGSSRDAASISRLIKSAPAAKADVNAALAAAAKLFSSDGDTRRMLLLALSQNPGPAEQSQIEAFAENGIQLFLVVPAALELDESWSQAIERTGGRKIATETGVDGLSGLLQAFLAAAKPQMIEIGGTSFQIDHVSKKVVVLARQDENQSPMMLIGPNNRRVTITNNKLSRKQSDFQMRTVGPLLVIEMLKPTTGLWRLKGADPASMVVLTRSRQQLHIMLPRARALESESLLLAAYLSRDGAIVKLIPEKEDIGFFATLVTAEGSRVSSALLSDDGEFPDQIAGDGIFTTTIPLEDLNGDYTLWVIAHTTLVSRVLSDRVTVLPGEWVTLQVPDKPLIPGGKRDFGLHFSHDLPFAPHTQVSLNFNGIEAQLKSAGDSPLDFSTELSIAPTDESKQKTLTVTKTVVYSDLLTDIQTRHLSVDITKAPKSWPVVPVLLIILALVNLAGVAAWQYRRKHKQAAIAKQQDEKPKAPAQAKPAHKPKLPMSPRPPMPPKPPEPPKPVRVDNPITDQMALDSFSDRIGEVAAVHKGEAVKADIERVELRPEDLDRDGDSSLASGSAFDGTDQWGQMLETRKEISNVAVEHDDKPAGGEFDRLTGEDISDIFNSVWSEIGMGDEAAASTPKSSLLTPSAPTLEEEMLGFTASIETPMMEEDMLSDEDFVEVETEIAEENDERILSNRDLEDLIERQRKLFETKKEPTEE
jgi:hypothetical protein